MPKQQSRECPATATVASRGILRPQGGAVIMMKLAADFAAAAITVLMSRCFAPYGLSRPDSRVGCFALYGLSRPDWQWTALLSTA